MLLTAELLLHYQRCNRRAFLDVYGDLNQRDPPSDYLMKLFQDSVAHQRSVLQDTSWLSGLQLDDNLTTSYVRPDYAAGNWAAGAEATRALMEQGVDCIYQGVVLAEDDIGAILVGIPDLLVKQPGRSYFGDWIYTPVEIKLGKRPKLEYQIVVAFYVKVIAAMQGAWPESAWLFLRGKGLYRVDLWELIPQMQTLLEESIQALQVDRAPEVFISRSRCNLCHWFNYCYSVAQAEQHLSLLPGVTPNRYVYLQNLNLTTVAALAHIAPQALENLPGFGREVAHKLVRQAQSVLENRAIAFPDLPTSKLLATGPYRLPTAPVELYFDIEAEPDLNLAYLHGVLVVNRQTQTETFHPFLAERPEDEPLIWQQFLELVWLYPQAPIFHFCSYEAQTVERLAKLYGTPWHRIGPLLKRFVDIHERVTQMVTLPVESYALKHIARWLGFSWRNSEANGAQSIYWYAQWLATGDRTFLESILSYNEDDCRATYHVKDWLVSFIDTATPSRSHLTHTSP